MAGSDENRGYITDNLDRALSERWIKDYYMPVVRSSNGRVCSEEALARWVDPERGMLSPAEFIPALEESKTIYKLDLYIVEAVLRKMKTQAGSGLYVVPISVNLSRTDFDSCDIVEEVKKRVDDSGIPREKLIIEVTESALGNDPEYMKVQIEKFQELGFAVWMDDFGSGYSSLDVLREMYFDHIKFDIKFMQHFEKEKSRIMLTELVRMAMALEIKTVAEGVETREQAEFLREIGCNKMQGYYFCKPIPLEEILDRYKKGIQIGFENPAESDYYDVIGRINLYDMSLLAADDGNDASFQKYFDTFPVVAYEVDKEGYRVSRCNKAYRKFTKRFFKQARIDERFEFADLTEGSGFVYSDAVRRTAETGNRSFFDAALPGGSMMRAMVRRIAVNPVTGVAACVLIVMDIFQAPEDRALDYKQVASALSSDYLYLFYINLKTDQFVEYSHSAEDDSLSVQRSGEDFFTASERDIHRIIYEEDRERMLKVFTRENVLKTIDEQNAFMFGYRMIIDGEPVYVNMKAVRMGTDMLLIGVNNVDAQMKYQREYDRMQQERLAFARIKALVGEFICVYIVDPETGHYKEITASEEYGNMDVRHTGEDFFADCRDYCNKLIYPGDADLFKAMFTKEKMLEEIDRAGQFTMIYRLMIKGLPQYVELKASVISEDEGPRIIVGVNYYS